MEPTVFAAVLIAAAFHAGWNAIVKFGLDRFLSVSLIAISAGAVSLVLTPFFPMPHAVAWPWILLSTVLHTGYKLFLARAYRTGDLGQVYPVARGAAPLLTTAVMAAGFGEALTLQALLGIGTLVIGIWLISVRGGRDLARLDLTTILYALGTSVFIASYTITDGLGARANGSATSYALWLFVLDGVCSLGLLLVLRRFDGVLGLRPYWRRGLAGGGMSLAAYWIVIWATLSAPIALVAALRESSVLFATVISVLLLREPLTRWRALSAILIVAGIVLMRLATPMK